MKQEVWQEASFAGRFPLPASNFSSPALYIQYMQLNQVLVVYKQVSTSPHGKRGSFDRRVHEGNALHLSTLNGLYEVLKDLGISFQAQSIDQLKMIDGVDLVITVGGDGTVLAASHFVHKVPILGIKSFGRHSVGYFCAATGRTMRKYLTDLMKGKCAQIGFHRLQVSINGQKVDELALNDVLFANAMPASTSKYRISTGGISEEQKSSGVWISTAAGSTAAIRAAGGKVLPLRSDRIQYLVREPYFTGKKYKLLKGVLPPRRSVKIISSIPQGTIYIDGGSTQYPVPTGSVVTVTGAGRPLQVYWR